MWLEKIRKCIEEIASKSTSLSYNDEFIPTTDINELDEKLKRSFKSYQ